MDTSTPKSQGERIALTKVCELCYEAQSPDDLSLITDEISCRLVTEHGQNTRYAFIRVHKGIMCRVKAECNQSVCFYNRDNCRIGLNCPLAHNVIDHMKNNNTDCQTTIFNIDESLRLSNSKFCFEPAYTLASQCQGTDDTQCLLQDSILPINSETYKRKYKALLHYEKKNQDRILQRKCNGAYTIEITQPCDTDWKLNDQYSLYANLKFSDNAMYIFKKASDRITITINGTECVACLIRCLANGLYLGFNYENAQTFKLHSKTLPTKVDVKFNINCTYFDKLCHTIDTLSDRGIVNLFPSITDFKNDTKATLVLKEKYLKFELDEYQKCGLQRILLLSCCVPLLVCGPRGSGKTYLLSAATSYLINECQDHDRICRILLCCYEQKSCQDIMTKYLHGEQYKNVKPLKIFTYFSHNFLECKHLAIVTTFECATQLYDIIPSNYFTHIFIDDSSLTIEPECLGPLLLANECTKIVIAGDTHQDDSKLCVLGDNPEQYGLRQSLLQRLHINYNDLGNIAQQHIIPLKHELDSWPDFKMTTNEQKAADNDHKITDNSSIPANTTASKSSKKKRKRKPKKKSSAAAKSNETNHDAPVDDSNQSRIDPLLSSDSSINTDGITLISPIEDNILPINPLNLPSDDTLTTTNTAPYTCGMTPLLVLSKISKLGDITETGTETNIMPTLLLHNDNTSTETNLTTNVHASSLTSNKLLNETSTDQLTMSETNIPVSSLTNDDLPNLIETSPLSNEINNSNTHFVDDPFSLSMPSSYSISDSFIDHYDELNWSYSSTNVMSSECNVSYSSSILSRKMKTQECIKKNQKKNKKLKSFSKFHISSSFPSSVYNRTGKFNNSYYYNRHTSPGPLVLFDAVQPILFPNRTISRDDTRLVHDNVEEDQISYPSLTSTEYKDKFHRLLDCEENRYKYILKERYNGVYTITVFGQNYLPNLWNEEISSYFRLGSLSGRNIDLDELSCIISERQNVSLQFENITIHAEIVKDFIENDKSIDSLLIAFSREEMEKLVRLEQTVKNHEFEFVDVKVEFQIKTSYFDQMHKALDKISLNVIKKINPSCSSDFTLSSNFKPQLHLHSKRLENILQINGGNGKPYSLMNALEKLLTCIPQKAPVLIAGSFGTGKTRLLARAAYHILQTNVDHRVLICTHHHKSADTFIHKYFAEMHEHLDWFIKPIRLISFDYNNEAIPIKYKEYYKNAHSLKTKENMRLVITTFLTSSELCNLRKGFFTHILIDEGAQSMEPETIIPLCLADVNTQIIIAGDHKQVGPMVLSDDGNDLKKSLLERLHESYPKFGHASDIHCSTLLHNFSCHQAILSLPSYLFYGSSLITDRVASEIKLHPKTKFPLHFICSSISEENEQLNSSCKTEVNLLLNEIVKYVDKWPKEWGRKNLKKIAIVVTTLKQKLLFMKSIHLKYSECLSQVTILTTSTMQGQEFEAVFFSTIEPTTADGKSKNPIKSSCSQFVFNTVITRARSLVVCIGNPLLLMAIEEHINNESLCWKDYIRRCMLARTFSIPENVTTHTKYKPPDIYCTPDTQQVNYTPDTQQVNNTPDTPQVNYSIKLQQKVFQTQCYDCSSFKNSDSIVRAYKNAMNTAPHYIDCKKELDEVILVSKTETTANYASVEDGHELIKCELMIHSHSKEEAIPCLSNTKSQKQKPIRIVRRDGDIVNVKCDTASGCKYGKVVSIVKSRRPNKFICRCNLYNRSTLFFRPLDKNVPDIINLPKISRKSTLPKHIFSDRHYVTVFVESSLPTFDDNEKEEQLPQIKELIPQTIAQNLLFVVQVIGRSSDRRQLLGAVIETMPKTSNLFITEKLLKIAYEINETEINVPLVDPSPCNDIPHYRRAFTIDSPGTINMDDAISLVPLEGEDQGQTKVYKLGIHISNVAQFIDKDSELDYFARRRVSSVYNTHNGAIHMLPISLSTSQFSLQYNKTCDVLSVFATVLVSNGNIVEVTTAVQEDGPQKLKITSQAQLTYEAAQKVMDGQPLNDTETQRQINIFDRSGFSMALTLQLLFKIAMKLQINRLGKFHPEDDVDKDSWQSHFLVSELMIWANSCIAKYLYSKIQDIALVRRQLPLELKAIQHMQTSYGNVLLYSPALIMIMMNQAIEEIPNQHLVVTSDWLSLIQTAYNKGDYNLLVWILSNDFLIPQLTQARHRARKISFQSEYKPTHGLDDIELAHYSLNLSLYTHFTSPIRRYFDILVQRLLNAIIDKTDITYEVEELQEICRDLNKKTKLVQKFDRTLNKVKIVQVCETSLTKYEGFLAKQHTSVSNKNCELLIFDPDKLIKQDDIDSTFEIAHLNLYKFVGDIDLGKLQWHVVSASLTESFSKRDSVSEASFSTLGPGFPEFIPFTKEHEQSFENDPYCIKAICFKYLTSDELFEERRIEFKSYFTSFPVTTHTVDHTKWNINDIIQTKSTESIKELMACFPDIDVNKAEVNQPQELLQSPVIINYINRSFELGEKLKVWIGKSVSSVLPTPCIQLLEVAQNIQVCVQHNHYPPQSFTEIHQASKLSYYSIDEYINLWSKVLIAEISNEGVNETHSINLLRNVALEWPELIKIENCVDSIHYEPNGSVSFNIPNNKADIHYFIKINVGDLICSRYNVTTVDGKELCAVYHFIVTDKKGTQGRRNTILPKGDVTVMMKAMGSSPCQVSEKMMPYLKTHLCDLQIITMPVSFKRVFKCLQCGQFDESANSYDDEAGSFIHDDISMSRAYHDNEESGENSNHIWSHLALYIALGDHSNSELKGDYSWIEDDPYALKLWEPNKENISLNELQIVAVKSALRNSFKLIQGPPGTGKSIVGAHLAYIFSSNNDTSHCVLYCCPSNKAVDVVHKQLQILNKRLIKNPLRLIRLYGRMHERKDFPNPYHNLCFLGRSRNDIVAETEGRCLEEFQKDSLHFKIRQRQPLIETTRKLFLQLFDKEIVPSFKELEEYKKLIKDAEKEELSMKYDVVLCTCNEACSSRLLRLARRSVIAQCIIDECGMAHEPETIAASSLCEHVILLGDHKQLQPVVKYKEAKRNGLSRSLFERYADRDDKNLLHQLKRQYRMHETICNAPSKLFYEDMLETDESVNNRKPLTPLLNEYWRGGQHVMIYDVIEDENTSQIDSYFSGKVDIHSKSNQTEALQVLEVAHMLRQNYNVFYERIAVLTPYAAQKDRLKAMLTSDKRFKTQKHVPKVTSIIESQGDEYDIVILSTVRSLPLEEIEDTNHDTRWMRKNLGFVTDKHQINVGITRAKHGLIIIGNVKLLEYNSTWKTFFGMYSNNIIPPLKVTNKEND